MKSGLTLLSPDRGTDKGDRKAEWVRLWRQSAQRALVLLPRRSANECRPIHPAGILRFQRIPVCDHGIVVAGDPAREHLVVRVLPGSVDDDVDEDNAQTPERTDIIASKSALVIGPSC